MALPHDHEYVLKAFRLGWYVAEVRGRNRPNGPQQPLASMPSGDVFPLPLRIERTATERRIEAQGVLVELAQELCVDTDPQGGSYGKTVDVGAHRLADARKAKSTQAGDTQWKAMAKVLWDFDAHVQDELTAGSEIRACAYQLGRGLSESYWALDPDRTDGAQGWAFLFGDERCGELSRLLGRLSAYLSTYTGSAIGGSLEVWKEYAKTVVPTLDPTADAAALATAQRQLREQIRRWYELVALGQDPTTLMRPFAVLRSFRTLKQFVLQFWPQVAATVIGLGFLVGFIVLLVAGSGSEAERTVDGVLAGVGISIGGITGALKNSAQSLLVRLRQDTYTELITEGVTAAPPELSRTAARKAIARRSLTPVTPN